MTIRATLFGWNAKRAGGTITITHTSGKVSGIVMIQPEGGRIVAIGSDGLKYDLHIA